MEVQVLSAAPKKGNSMSIKYSLLVFLFFVGKNLFSQSFMMNCVSSDFKDMAFYKYEDIKKKLYIRPMKSRWTDFCIEINFDEENVSCKFDGLLLSRNSLENNNNNLIKTLYKVNFADYSLSKTVSTSNKERNLNKKNEIQYKCKKIKI